MHLRWNFPPEVESLIFDEINVIDIPLRESVHDRNYTPTVNRSQDVNDQLLVCSRVCKRWRHLALERYFQLVSVRGTSRRTEFMLRARQTWGCKLQVHKLELGTDLAPKCFGMLSSGAAFNRLRYLIMSRHCSITPQLALFETATTHLHVLSLEIDNQVQREELLSSLNGMPNLKILHLRIARSISIPGEDEEEIDDEDENEDEDDRDDPTECLLFQLEEFSLQDKREISIWSLQATIDIYAWLLKSSGHSLHTISIGNLRLSECLTAAFRSFGPSLQHLEILENRGPVMVTTLLPLCSNVTHVTLGAIFFSLHYIAIVPLWPASLTSLRLVSYNKGMTLVRPLPLAENSDIPLHKILLEVFSNPSLQGRFALLKVLIVDTREGTLAADALSAEDPGLTLLHECLCALSIELQIVKYTAPIPTEETASILFI